MSQESKHSDRYIASEAEKEILTTYGPRWKSFSDRSSERAESVTRATALLRAISDHWTDRTVRLWFNNNQHSFGAGPPPARTVHFCPEREQTSTAAAPVILAQTPPQPQQAIVSPRIEALVRQAKRVRPGELGQIVNQFDSVCREQKVEGKRIVNSCASREGCNLAIPPRPPSVVFSFDAGKSPIDSRSPSVPPDLFWEQRVPTDLFIYFFEASFMDRDVAAFVCCADISPERSLSFEFTKNREAFGKTWQTRPLGVRGWIQHVVVDAPSECAWFFARHQVHRISLGKQPRTQHVAVPGLESTNGLIAPLVMKNGRLVIGLPESPQLYFVNDSLKIDCIQPNFGCRRGYSVVCPFGDRLLCGLLDSVAIRLIDETGIEANAFVGHADTPKFLSPISKDCFVSAGDDRAVNLWDVRESVPITHIDLAPRDILGVCGCETCVVFSLDDKTICSVDIRALPNRPMLGLSLDDYHASSIYYDDHSNSLRLFGAASISGDSNSLLFLNDGINRKYILRQYHNFFPGI